MRLLDDARNAICSQLACAKFSIAALILHPRDFLRDLGTSSPEPLPRILPTVRPRSLTCPSVPSTSDLQQEAMSTQTQSLMLQKLPLEIRREIYHHVLGGETLHVVRLASRLGNVKCREIEQSAPWRHRCWGIPVKDSDVYWGPYDDTVEEQGGFLPLLQTCRKVYIEAVEILYSKNMFSMLHIESLLQLSYTILPHRLNAIQLLELGWYVNSAYPYDTGFTGYRGILSPPYDETTWGRSWATLAGMEGLRVLQVYLVRCWLEPLTLDAERMLLSPVMKVVNPRVWNLALGWPDTGANFQDAPFRIIRDSGGRALHNTVP